MTLEQGFFTAVDFKSILRWNMTPTDLEEWACSSFPTDSPREDPPLQQLYRVLLDPAMQAHSPLLGPTVLKVTSLLTASVFSMKSLITVELALLSLCSSPHLPCANSKVQGVTAFHGMLMCSHGNERLCITSSPVPSLWG